MRGSRHRSLVIALLALVVALSLAGIAYAKATKVVTVGADLTGPQRSEMLALFKVKEGGSTAVLEVTNQEEREYLEGVVPDAQIGTRAISSVYVNVRDGGGTGVDVQTKNITYVTEQTYANAAVTAGVKDADIFAAAPFPVSGTAALTGIFKGFEQASGEQLPEENKKTATEELQETAQVGEETGDREGVAELMKRAKEEMARQGLKDEASIRQVVINISNELNLDLSQEHIDQLTQILVQIGRLDLDVDSLTKQLQDFQDRIGLTDEQAKGLLGRIGDFFRSLFDALFG